METWLDSLGEWSWPGAPSPVAELVPAPWIPALPLRLDPRRRAQRQLVPRRLRLARLALLIGAGAVTFVVTSSDVTRPRAPAPVPAASAAAPVRLAALARDPFAAPAALPAAATSGPPLGVLAPPPFPVALATDGAGSTIAAISFRSRTLGWRDTYLVYLPPGYRAAPARRYPALYLLHGDQQPASSFLRLGLQPVLDRLIATRAIAPLIAVMLKANGLPNNWRNTAGPQYQSYVGEVVRVTDRTLRTLAARASRGIAGYSMGGFGAMNVALSQLRTFSVVESWEGYFNNLASELAADRSLLARLPLHAFVWGGRQDTVASSAEDGPWAAALRAAGADAQSAVYPGGHTFTPLRAHLAQMLTFAARALRT
jgi:S-formylglutathione hydrolase FrmB